VKEDGVGREPIFCRALNSRSTVNAHLIALTHIQKNSLRITPEKREFFDLSV